MVVLLAGICLWWFGRDDAAGAALRPEGESAATGGNGPGLDRRMVESRSTLTAPDEEMAAERTTRANATLQCLVRGTFEALGPDRIECAGDGVARWDEATRAFRLPPGRWRVSSLEPEIVVPQGSFRVRAGERSLVWASERTELSVLVTDEYRRPLEGATVRWTAFGRRAGNTFERPEWNSASEGRTNSRGRCLLSAEANRPGGLQVLLEGYRTVNDSRIALDSNTSWTVRMKPKRSTEQVSTLLVRDASTGAPIPSPWARKMETPSRWAGDESGRVRMPYAVVDAGTLTIGAEGYRSRTWFFRTVEPEYDIPLSPTKSISVVVELPADGHSGTLLVLPAMEESTPDGRSPIWFAESYEAPSGEPILVEFPESVPMDLLAYDELGHSARARVEGRSRADPLYLRLEARPSEDLLIEVRTQRGDSPEAIALADLDAPISHRTLRIRSQGGVLRIPFAERIDDVSVRAEGYATAELRLTENVAPALEDTVNTRAGSVQVTLVTGTDLEVRVVDDDDRPLGGFYVRLDDDRNLEAFHARPELHGAWPTDHPAWMETEPNFGIHRSRTTGTDGRVQLRDVPTLSLEVSAHAHPEIAPRFSASFLPDGAREVDLSSGGVESVTLRLPRSRAFELVVVDALTDLPVPSFEVRGGLPGEDSSRTTVDGSYWADLVPEGARLTVEAPGYLARELTFEAGDETRRRVRLTPAAEGRLRFHGADLTDALLTYRIESDDGLRNLGAHRRAGFEEREDGFRPAASFPGGGRLFLTSVAVDGEEWSFEPEVVPLPLPTDGPAVRVQVSRE